MNLQTITKHRVVSLKQLVADATDWCRAMCVRRPGISYRHFSGLVATMLNEEYLELLDAKKPLDIVDALVDMIWVASNFLAFNDVPAPDNYPAAPKPIAVYKYKLCAALYECRQVDDVLDAFNPLVTKCWEQATKTVDHVVLMRWCECVRAANYSKLWTAPERMAAITLSDGPIPQFTNVPGAVGLFVGRNSDGKIIKPPSFRRPEELYKEHFEQLKDVTA